MMQPIVIRLPDEDRNLLAIEAKREGKPVAEVARKAIKAYFKKKPKAQNGAEILLKWAKRSEKYKSRFKDENLSTTYKEYLYGSKSPKFGHLWKNKK